jgi:hypothetical protein
VRRIVDSLYTTRRDGLPGNEDCGQMSAWLVFSALGFYPVDPAQDAYVIGTPLFPRVTLHLPNGRSFTVTREGGRAGTPYVLSATLGGQPFDRVALRHAEILAGGTLAFRMTDRPAMQWASAPDAAPRSRMEGPRVTAAPFVARGETRFRGTPRIALACADTGVTIGFVLSERRGAELMGALTPQPPQSEVEFALPDTTCILRFFAQRAGQERSPLQQVRFVHLEGNRRVVTCTAPHRAYTADGPDALIDGIRGGDDFRVPQWMGFYGTDVEVVVDLGETRTVQRLAAGFLQDQNSWIFMPRRVTFATSRDGAHFTEAGVARNTVEEHEDGVVVKDLAVEFPPRPARYLRMRVTAPVMCPDWHKGAGNRSFVFADEFVFE